MTDIREILREASTSADDYFAQAADEIERLRVALLAITKCDDDGYGPDGYCVNIAKAALEQKPETT